MRKNTVHIVNTFKLTLAVLFVALVGAQSPSASAQTPTAPTQSAAPSASGEAKRVLDAVGARDFKRVKDADMRRGLTRAVAALKALAKNTSPGREAGLVENFDRAVKTLKSLPQPAAADTRPCDAHYDRCIEMCKLAGGNYGKDCKLCGIEQNGCYLTKLALEMTKNPLDPTS